MVLHVAADGRSAVKMVVSYGGEIVRCPYTGKSRYAGGENRIVRVGMSERLGELRARLAAIAGYSYGVRIRYALEGPGGDGLDSLHDVADEHDLWVLVTRLCCCDGLAARDGRVRAFLSPVVVDAAPQLAPDRVQRTASAPLLLNSSNAVTAEATTLGRSQSAIALYAPAATPVMSSSGGDASAAQHVDPGFEALAEIAAAQRSRTGHAASSSGTSSGSGAADGGAFDARPVAIAAAHSSAAACGATAMCAAQADSRVEALAVVAAEQSGQVSPPRAPVFFVLVVPMAPVFFSMPPRCTDVLSHPLFCKAWLPVPHAILSCKDASIKL
jgi:hypothetical protein